HVIDSALYVFTLVGAQPVLGAQREERVDGRVRERARGIRLHRDAGRQDLPLVTERLERAGAELVLAEGRGITLRAVEGGVGGGEALARQHGGEHAVARGVPGVERL